MPSKYEGFGLVALECMTFSKPVLGSKVGGLQTIINESCGYVCGSDKKTVDRKLFVEKAVELLTDEKVYQEKANSARKRAKEYDNYNQYMETILNTYEEIIKANEKE